MTPANFRELLLEIRTTMPEGYVIDVESSWMRGPLGPVFLKPLAAACEREPDRMQELVAEYLTLALPEVDVGDPTRDGLTGLVSKLGLERMWAELSRRRGTLVAFDIVGTVELNDWHGLAATDQLITQIAGRLLSVTRARWPDVNEVGSSAILARVGGDEFLLVVPDHVDAAETSALATESAIDDVEPHGVRFSVGRLPLDESASTRFQETIDAARNAIVRSE